MSKAAAFVRSRMVPHFDVFDAARKGVVLFCGASLLAAGPLLPTLG